MGEVLPRPMPALRKCVLELTDGSFVVSLFSSVGGALKSIRAGSADVCDIFGDWLVYLVDPDIIWEFETSLRYALFGFTAGCPPLPLPTLSDGPVLRVLPEVLVVIYLADAWPVNFVVLLIL